MKVAVLFSGGKDSTYAAYLAKQHGHNLSCLISLVSENPESYMFHTPNIEWAEKQAQAAKIPLLIQRTTGKKEKELVDLEFVIKKAKQRQNIKGVVTGTIESAYQASRIQRICDRLDLDCFNPLWQKDPEEYWDDLLKNGFEIIITGLAAEGMGEEWLGQKIDKKMLNKLKDIRRKFKIHLSFEGGEAETFVVDCPLFYKKLTILKSEKNFSKNNGTYRIVKIGLDNK
jgi:ABC transporter with metal-binding/Fe-S-binding domain ATP-binding protein